MASKQLDSKELNTIKPFTAQSVLSNLEESQKHGMFRGRLSRLGLLLGILYWSSIIILSVALAAIVTGFAHGHHNEILDVLSVLCTAICIVTILLSYVFYVSFMVRRFHDLDRSGLFALLILVPLLNSALIIILIFIPGTKDTNRFGEIPRSNLSFRDVNGL